MTLEDAVTGRIVVVTPEQQADLAYFVSAVRKHQNRALRRVARLLRRVQQHVDLHDGYLDLGGEA